MKPIIRADGILAPETSDRISGRQVLSTCEIAQTWEICTGIFFLSGKMMLRLFHAEVAPSSHSL